MIKKHFIYYYFLLLGSIIYLNFFGISTKKFNQKIETKIQDKLSTNKFKIK